MSKIDDARADYKSRQGKLTAVAILSGGLAVAGGPILVGTAAFALLGKYILKKKEKKHLAKLRQETLPERSGGDNMLYPTRYYDPYGYGGCVVSTPESPQTAIARIDPSIAARVLETMERANFHNKGAATLEAITREAIRQGKTQGEVEIELAGAEYSYFGLVKKGYRFKGITRFR